MGWRNVHTASASDAPASPAMRIPVAAVRCARARVVRADRVGGEGGGGDRERERDHEAERREIRHDLVARHHAGAEPGHQQGDEREGRRLDRVGQAHRDAELDLLADDGPAGPRAADREAEVERVEARVRPARREEPPEDDARGERAAHRAQARQPERAEDQAIAQDHLQREPGDLHAHDDVRPRHRDVERGDRPEHQRGGHGHREDAQVSRHQGLDVGRGVDPSEPRLGKREEAAARDREQQRQPEPLHVARADGGVPAPAVMLPDDGIERVEHAEEAHEDARVDPGPEAHRGEVGGRGVAGEDGVHDPVQHHRDLADEDRPRLVEDAARDRSRRRRTRMPRWAAPGHRRTT